MFGTDESPETKLARKFWKDLDDSPFIMLGLKGVDDDRTRPMTAQVDVPEDGDKEDGGQIYFFASKSDGVGQAVQGSARAVATFVGKGHGLFAHIHGTLVPSDDRAVIERLWNPFIASWYKDGKTDPDLQLLRFDTESADVWEATPGATLKAAALKTLFNIDPGKDHSAEHQATIDL
ncbi:pyridoxamine 5'-phosphate oxidase family protein [Sphingomonas sp.]|uniref:pyridoxamine 5'-phosphate oxidase family protein n=1 Tax=Sphingomonas sp. TaxID=28214 RepID=UPI00286C684D|nr:pyridoxamine 5'-phosphate oxidase family protein [Sphingomonas sp.]